MRLGYCAVKNRSKEDHANNMTFKEGLDKEYEYFCGHPVYSVADLPQSSLGYPGLIKRLIKLIFMNIHVQTRKLVGEVKAALKEKSFEFFYNFDQLEENRLIVEATKSEPRRAAPSIADQKCFKRNRIVNQIRILTDALKFMENDSEIYFKTPNDKEEKLLNDIKLSREPI